MNWYIKYFACSSLKKAGGKEVNTSNQEDGGDDLGDLMGEEEDKSLHLKGQMMFMAEWNVIMFMSSPILSDMDALGFNGLFVNDLPMHDFSRDLLFIGKYFKKCDGNIYSYEIVLPNW